MRKKPTRMSPLQQRLAKMETLVRSHKKIKFAKLCFEMFGGTRPTDRVKTCYLVGQLRSKLKKEKGELFYSIAGEHQIVRDERTFIALVEASKQRTKDNMLSIQKNIQLGFQSFPDAKKGVLKLREEMKYLLNADNENS